MLLNQVPGGGLELSMVDASFFMEIQSDSGSVGLTHLHVLAAEEAPAVAAGSRHDLDRVLQVSEPPCTVL